ncbi:hypothetical protein KFE25_010992 [Diacronema lutheri]|uniref:START domain-containing protein n=1 Tax=Diacronema lutheri TaxID=2081491 RepID=A0A8J5XAM8_DIALT|nr:hypothetical protein KFE25_010992 [Diacronema lutheri]
MHPSALVVWLAALPSILSWRAQSPARWRGTRGVALLGEQDVTEPAVARLFAEEMLREAHDFWAAPRDAGWVALDERPGLTVESIGVDEGPFAADGLLLMRAAATVRVAGAHAGGDWGARARTADAIFELLTSPRGYEIIDPLTEPDGHAAPLARVPGWRWPHGRLEVARAVTPSLPGLLAPREFCVLNAIDIHSRTFSSKSVRHASMPREEGPAAPVRFGVARAPGARRAINTFALRVSPADAGAHLEMLNYIDLQSHPAVSNTFCALFFRGVLIRLERQMRRDPLSLLV